MSDNVSWRTLDTSYRNDLAEAEAAAVRDMSENLNKQLAEAKAKNVKLLITDDFRAQMKDSYRIGRVFSLNARYKNRIDEWRKECNDKAEPVVRLINKSILAGLAE